MAEIINKSELLLIEIKETAKLFGSNSKKHDLKERFNAYESKIVTADRRKNDLDYCESILTAIVRYQQTIEEEYELNTVWTEENYDKHRMSLVEERSILRDHALIAVKLTNAYCEAGLFEDTRFIVLLSKSVLALYGVAYYLFNMKALEQEEHIVTENNSGVNGLLTQLISNRQGVYEKTSLSLINIFSTIYWKDEHLPEGLKLLFLLGRRRLTLSTCEKDKGFYFDKWCFYLGVILRHLCTELNSELKEQAYTVIEKYAKYLTDEEMTGVLATFSWAQLSKVKPVRDLVLLFINSSSFGEKAKVQYRKNVIKKNSAKGNESRERLMFYFLDLPVITYHMTDILLTYYHQELPSDGEGRFERDVMTGAQNVRRYEWPKNTLYYDDYYLSSGGYWQLGESDATWLLKNDVRLKISVSVEKSEVAKRRIYFSGEKIDRQTGKERKISVAVDGAAALHNFNGPGCDEIFQKIFSPHKTVYNNMRVSYLYLNFFHQVGEQHISFDHSCLFRPDKKQLSRTGPGDDRGICLIPNFYGKKVYSMTCLVGENGAGKTSITDFLHNSFITMKDYIDNALLTMQDIIDCAAYLRDEDVHPLISEKKLNLYKRIGLDRNCQFVIVFIIRNRNFYISNFSIQAAEDFIPYSSAYKGGLGSQEMKFMFFSGKIFLNGEKYLGDATRSEAYHFWDQHSDGTGSFMIPDYENQLFSARMDDIQTYVASVDYSENGSSEQRLKNKAKTDNKSYYDTLYQYTFLKEIFINRGLLKTFEGKSFEKLAESSDIQKLKYGNNQFIYDNLDFFYALSKMKYVQQVNTDVRVLSLSSFLANYESTPKDFDGVFFPLSSGQFNRFAFVSKLYFALAGKLDNKLRDDDLIQRTAGKDETLVLTIDEGEIYYHPEWQRLFIKEILDIVNFSNEEIVDGAVQIILTTNSPFMLSDIRSEDIVLLSNETMQNIKGINRTFGQNIHTLLRNRFFMRSTIGEYSRTMISWMLEVLTDPSYMAELLEQQYNLLVQFDQTSDRWEIQKWLDETLELVKRPEMRKIIAMYCIKNNRIGTYEETIRRNYELLDHTDDACIELVCDIVDYVAQNRSKPEWKKHEEDYVNREIIMRFGTRRGNKEYSLGKHMSVSGIIEAVIESVGEDIYRGELLRLFDEYRERIWSNDDQLEYYRSKVRFLEERQRNVVEGKDKV